jgi:lipoprotein-anchoring transpeptidase ErfK/SrfK
VAAAEPPRRNRAGWFVLVALLFLLTAVAGVVAGTAAHLYAGDLVLPGVRSLGVVLGGQTEEQAAATLASAWEAQTVALTHEGLSLAVPPADLGMTLDAAATAETAYWTGRTIDSLTALRQDGLSIFTVPPVWAFDPGVAEATLTALAPQLAVAPTDARVIITGTTAEAVPAADGRELDIAATLAALGADPAAVLQSGRLPLATRPVPAAVQDVSAAVAEANRLLGTTVTLRAWDPIADQTATAVVDPSTWGRWLSLSADPAAPGGYRWTVDGRAAEDFLTTWAAAQFGDGRYLAPEETVAALSDAIQAQQPEVTARVYYQPRQHTVVAGETLSSIGREAGIPYPWIAEANPGVENLSVGQTLLIPSPDVMLPLPPVAGKRIEVSLGEQRARVYENGQLKWDWPASTGIADSPTAPGVFQIQSHEPNAYAGNWDLWMPSFMGIYRPVPPSDFMNGFHGFPTRGNAQLLWTGDLGRPVTYGCILLSSENAQTLYDWAEAGVVVEVGE